MMNIFKAARKSFLLAIAALFLGGIFFFAPSAHATTFFASGTISTANTWTANNVYVIQSSLTIGSGGTLTINSSTVVKLGQGASLDVAASGALKANGVSTGKIYFTALDDDSQGGDTNGDGTSTTPHTGDSGYIESDPGSSSTLTYTIVSYGAPSPKFSALYQLGGNLTLSHATVASSSYGIENQDGALSISTSTFSTNSAYGIYEFNSTGSITLASSTFLNNGSGGGNDVEIDLGTGLTFTPSGNSATGTTSTGAGPHGFWVVTVQGTRTTNATFAKDLPYVFPGNNFAVDSGATLTVNHGAIVKIGGQSADLELLSGSTLNVQGTAADPVYFTALDDDSVGGDTNADGTATSPNPGDSGFIELQSGSNSTIAYANIRYGGKSASFSNIYQLGGNLTLNNSQVASSWDYGLYLGGGTSTINSSEFATNTYGIYVASGTLSVINSSFHGNGSNGIYNSLTATSTAYAENNYWNASSGPYNVNSNPGGTGDLVSDYVDYQNWLTNWNIASGTLAQYKSDATTTLSDGSSTTETTVVFGATLQLPVGTSTLQLQVEATTSATFANIANATSAFVSSGQFATATLALFPESSSNGNYHWQYRVVASPTGAATPWLPYSSNSTDFIISTIPLYMQATSSIASNNYPSNSNTTGTFWWAPKLLDNIATNTIADFGCTITSVVMDLRSYGITTDASSSNVDPANINTWLENSNNSSTGYGSGGALNWQDIPYYAKTPSGVFRITYNGNDAGLGNNGGDRISSASSTWVNKWLNYSPTGTVPVILTIPAGPGISAGHFVVATGHAFNQATTTYTVRDAFFFNNMYMNQSSTVTKTWNYKNNYSGAHVFEPTSTTILPLYLEYAIDGSHTLLITDPNGKRLGMDSVAGITYNEISNGTEDDDQPGVHFLTIYTPVAGKYALTVGGSGQYQLASFVADGKHRPIPQVISSSTPSTAAVTYHQNYNPTSLPASTVQQ